MVRSSSPSLAKSTQLVRGEPATVKDDWIIDQLCAAGLATNARALHVELVPGNPERRDFHNRASFRVYRDRRLSCFLTLGRNLTDLWRRTKAFAEACPTISCPPLFHRRNHGWDMIAVEYFDGMSLESRVSDGSLSADDALLAAQRVHRALRATEKPATIDSAAREFDHFAASLFESPLFGGFDQGFLRDIILPYVRAGALAAPVTSRWTNGDFVARNVLVDAHGVIRLIDFEFASRTHFAAEDWWRWRTFSRLPDGLRDLPGIRESGRTGDWLEVYFILRQFLLATRINGAHLAVTDARAGFDRILAIIGAAHSGFRSSVFLASYLGDSRAAADSARLLPATVTAQLFWSPHGTFAEEHSQRVEYPQDHETPVRFMIPATGGPLHLRFDPSDRPGLVAVSSLRIRTRDASGERTVLHAGGPWDQLDLGQTILRLTDTPELNLLCLDSDPVILLPTLDLGAASVDVVFEVWVRYRSSLTTLPSLLIRPATVQPETLLSLQSAANEMQEQLRVSDERLEQADRELRRRQTQVEELEEQVRKTQGHGDYEKESDRKVIEGLRACTSDLEDRLRQAETQRQQSVAGAAVLRAERDQALAQREELHSQLRLLQEVQRQLAETQVRMQVEQHTCQHLVSELAASQTTLDQTRREAAEQQASLVNQAEEHKKTADALRTSVSDLEDRLRQVDTQRQQSDATVSELRAERDLALSRLQAVEARLMELEGVHRDLVDARIQIQGELSARQIVESEKIALQTAMDEARREVAATREHLEHSKRTVIEEESLLSELREQVNDFERRYLSSDERAARAKGENEALVSQLIDLQRKSETWVESLHHLNRALLDQKDSVGALHHELETTLTERNTLRIRVEELAAELSKRGANRLFSRIRAGLTSKNEVR